jgi:hypothetical protein
VLYSLTAVTKELLALRQPALTQLQAAASWASAACSKVRDYCRGQHTGLARCATVVMALRIMSQVKRRGQV